MMASAMPSADAALKEAAELAAALGLSPKVLALTEAALKAAAPCAEPLAALLAQLRTELTSEDSAAGAKRKRPNAEAAAAGTNAAAPPPAANCGARLGLWRQVSCKFAGCRAKTDVEICADALVFKAKGGDVAVPLASIGAVLPFAHPMAQKKQDIVVLHLAAPVGKISDILLTFDRKTQGGGDLLWEGSDALAGQLGLGSASPSAWLGPLLEELSGRTVREIRPSEKPIACHMGVDEGYLMLTPKGVLFFSNSIKALCFHPSTDIAALGASGATLRTFDLELKLRDGKVVVFTMVPRDDEEFVCGFVGRLVRQGERKLAEREATGAAAAAAADAADVPAAGSEAGASAPADMQMGPDSGRAGAADGAPAASDDGSDYDSEDEEPDFNPEDVYSTSSESGSEDEDGEGEERGDEEEEEEEEEDGGIGNGEEPDMD